MIKISVTVPLYNEQESVGPLVGAIRRALSGREDWELVLVDDGSRDATVEVAVALAADDPRVRLVRLARNYGQATAMQAGFDHARGEVVISMDGDLQNDPEDIPRLLAKLEEGYDLVTGYRLRRKDKLFTRKVPSWIANRIIRWMTGVPIRDNGCSLKAYRREVLERLSLYSDMHRFIPALAAATAGARIAEIPVRHHARKYGSSKYGLSRVPKVLADLLTIKMVRSFRDRPMLLFGSCAAAVVLLSLGLGAGTAVLVARGALRPDLLVLPGAALIFLGLAAFLLMLGLIAESVLRERFSPDPADHPFAREVSL